MKKIIFIAPLVVLITACGAPSVETLVENPKKLGEIIKKCRVLIKQGENANTDECNNANKAAEKMLQNMVKEMMAK